MSRGALDRAAGLGAATRGVRVEGAPQGGAGPWVDVVLPASAVRRPWGGAWAGSLGRGVGGVQPAGLLDVRPPGGCTARLWFSCELPSRLASLAGSLLFFRNCFRISEHSEKVNFVFLERCGFSRTCQVV